MSLSRSTGTSTLSKAVTAAMCPTDSPGSASLLNLRAKFDLDSPGVVGLGRGRGRGHSHGLVHHQML